MKPVTQDAVANERQIAGMERERCGEAQTNVRNQVVPQEMETRQSTGGNLIQGNVNNSQIRQNSSLTIQTPPIHKAVPKEPQGTQRTAVISSGSSQRKRSRVGEDGGHAPVQNVTKIHDCISNLNTHMENLVKSGQKVLSGVTRVQISDGMKEIMMETTNLLAKFVNSQEMQMSYLKMERQMKEKIITLQEENNNIKQQVIDLQIKAMQREQESAGIPVQPTYAQAATKNLAVNIINGRQLPLPQIAQSTKHAPSECIIIFKAAEKGTMMTKSEQEKFRKEVKDGLTEEERQGISVIRPTRFGGHTIICHNEKNRDMVYKKLRHLEEEKGIEENETNMVAPTKKVAKVVCKEVPHELSIEQIKMDMFGRHNPELQKINHVHRTGKIYRTRLGLIFELSGYEMMAIQNQGWRIRCDEGREMRVEEYISLQQCYACAKFGHSASECKALKETCRLCGEDGHAGKDCPERMDKEAWRCANCRRMNQMKDMNLDEKHAAAQLHKCPVALQQRTIRKIQLASTGIFTSPIQKGDEILKDKRVENGTMRRAQNGANIGQNSQETGRRNRSRSTRRTNTREMRNNPMQRAVDPKKFYGDREKRNENNENPCVQRIIRKIPQPQSMDGWNVVGKGRRRWSNSSVREGTGQDEMSRSEQMEVEEEEEILQTPMETRGGRDEG